MDKQITIDTQKTYTKSEYAKAFGISRPTLDLMIKSRQVNSIKVKGTTLILAK